MKTRRWVLILLIAAVTGAVLSILLLTQPPEGDCAEVYSCGELVCCIDLKNPEDLREYIISSGADYNIIKADSDGIRVIAASCRDGLCIRQGYLRAAPVVCLPNKLVIEWRGAEDTQFDAIAR